MSQYSKEFILFVSTIAGEAANSSRASWKAIAHVIMNRFKYKEWRDYQTITDIILKTGFDAAKEKNQPFLNVYNSLSTGNPSSLALQIIAAVKPIYDGIIKDPTGKVVLYYSPKAQLYLSQRMPHKYKRVPSLWDFNLLEEVKISGTENDDFKWYRYKNANKSKRLQIVNLDGQAIPDVPYEITHNKQGQEKVIVQGKTDQEGKTKEIPYQHAGKDVTIKINQSAGKRMPKANIQGMLLVTEIITKLISPYLKQRVILKPDGKPGNYAGMYHKVKKGETLTKIAQKLGTTVEALLHANPKITDPNKIYIGQKIRLPAKTGRPVARKENGEVKIDRPKARETNTQPPAEKVQTKSTVNTEANTQTGNREVKIEKPKAQETGNQPSARKVQMSPSSATGTASRPRDDNGEKQTPPQPRQKKEVKQVNSVDGKPVTVVKKNREIHDQNETKINKLHPQFQDKVRRFIKKVYEQHQIKLRIVQGYRTYREQDELYAKGRTMPGSKVTNAKGGQSNHNFGLAIDVFPIWQDGRVHMEDDAENIRLLKLIAHVGIEEGLAWGGNWRKFKDYPHFELKVGKNMAQLRAAVKAAGGDPLAVKYDI